MTRTNATAEPIHLVELDWDAIFANAPPLTVRAGADRIMPCLTINEVFTGAEAVGRWEALIGEVRASGVEFGGIRLTGFDARFGRLPIETLTELVQPAVEAIRSFEILEGGLILIDPPPTAPLSNSGRRFNYADALHASSVILELFRGAAECAGAMLAIEAPTEHLLHSPVETRDLIDRTYAGHIGCALNAHRLSKPTEPNATARLSDWIDVLNRRLTVVRYDEDSLLDAVFAKGARPPFVSQIPTARH
jgi:hypothetical protein